MTNVPLWYDFMICVAGLLTEFRRTAKLRRRMVQFFYNEDLYFFLTDGHHYYFSQWFIGSHLTWLKHGFSAISVWVKTKSDSHLLQRYSQGD